MTTNTAKSSKSLFSGLFCKASPTPEPLPSMQAETPVQAEADAEAEMQVPPEAPEPRYYDYTPSWQVAEQDEPEERSICVANADMAAQRINDIIHGQDRSIPAPVELPAQTNDQQSFALRLRNQVELNLSHQNSFGERAAQKS